MTRDRLLGQDNRGAEDQLTSEDRTGPGVDAPRNECCDTEPTVRQFRGSEDPYGANLGGDSLPLVNGHTVGGSGPARSRETRRDARAPICT